jgi:hypothetical protein
MTKRYASGKHAFFVDQRSGFKTPYREMVFDGQVPGLKVTAKTWEPQHPQEFPVSAEDPIALKHPTGDLDVPNQSVTATIPAITPDYFRVQPTALMLWETGDFEVSIDEAPPGIEDMIAGIRFASVDWSAYIVNSAVIKLEASGAWTDEVELHIRGVLADDIADFSVSNKPTDQTLTNMETIWNPGDWVDDTVYSSPDIYPIIEEIQARPGWVDGNAIAFVISSIPPLQGYRRFTSFTESETSGIAPELVPTGAVI